MPSDLMGTGCGSVGELVPALARSEDVRLLQNDVSVTTVSRAWTMIHNGSSSAFGEPERAGRPGTVRVCSDGQGSHSKGVDGSLLSHSRFHRFWCSALFDNER